MIERVFPGGAAGFARMRVNDPEAAQDILFQMAINAQEDGGGQEGGDGGAVDGPGGDDEPGTGGAGGVRMPGGFGEDED